MSTTNQEKLRKRLADAQKRNAGNKYLFKPEPGTTRVRIVPYKFNKEDPFIDLYFHYNFGTPPVTYLSPLTWGESDPINDFAKEFQLNSGGDK